ncbi:MAG: Crp/Fnr family transcriptional regulator [Limnohabitans sp.]|nr:MAG: Crp/Fnr family transcriptional regulator [Limnohabitans sp.]
MDLSRFNLPHFLSLLPLFQDLSPEELKRMAAGCRLRQFIRGEDVFRVGELCHEFHVVVNGQVKLFAVSPQGQEKIIEIAGPGNSFAEALMFLERPYIINAQALTETLLLSVDRSAVQQEAQNDVRFCMRMLAGLSRRLHGLVNDVQAYALHSGIERVIGYLLRELPENPSAGHDRDHTANVVLPVSKATIASRLSMTPEYFSRVLHELESQGLISMDKREIRIPDPDRLASYPMK